VASAQDPAARPAPEVRRVPPFLGQRRRPATPDTATRAMDPADPAGAAPQPSNVQGAPVPGMPKQEPAAHARPQEVEDAAIEGEGNVGAPLPSPALTRRDDARMQAMSNRREANQYLVEIHKKFALAFACFVFVLVGAPIALRVPRGGVGLTLGVSFGIFGLYYVGLISGESLADRNILAPNVAMWATNALMLAIGLVLAMRMGSETGSQRGGGGFAELVTRIQYAMSLRGKR
jgi:lipopolysaccharide export system permease protein